MNKFAAINLPIKLMFAWFGLGFRKGLSQEEDQTKWKKNWRKERQNDRKMEWKQKQFKGK